MDGDLNGIKEIIAKGGDHFVSLASDRNKTPLMFAAGYGHVEVVEFLLRQDNIDIYAISCYGNNVLHWLSSPIENKTGNELKNYYKIVELILEKEAQLRVDTKTRSRYENTLFLELRGSEGNVLPFALLHYIPGMEGKAKAIDAIITGIEKKYPKIKSQKAKLLKPPKKPSTEFFFWDEIKRFFSPSTTKEEHQPLIGKNGKLKLD
jgi:hypothetical protein